MNIGTDLDGVIADSDPVYRVFIKKFLGRELKREDVTSFFYEDCLGISIDEMNRVWDFFNEEKGWNKIKPVVGAIKYLNKFAIKNKIFVVSSRPVFLEKVTKDWLERYKIRYEKLILTDGQPKLNIIKDLNITHFIEDRLDFAQDMAKAGIKVLLFDYPWNQHSGKQPNLYRVKNWSDINEFFGACMKIIYSEKSAQYNISGHPEAPFRVLKTKEFLEKTGVQFVEPNYAKEKDILLAHTEELLNLVKSENFFDSDTPCFKGIYEYALLSVGAAIDASDYAVKNEFAFSLMRPPGHHAQKSFLGGFCYFNNIAIAVKHLLATRHRLKPATTPLAILDIDVHHGNGTQDIFLGDEKVLYVSLHQIPLYPGTGHKSEKNCLNFPLPAGTDETSYLKTLDSAIEEIVKFSPKVIGISAGFDTYEGDPLANFKLKKNTYKKIGKKISEIKAGKFAVLEGGYSQDLPELIGNFLEGIEQ